jgi:hypothetical protein
VTFKSRSLLCEDLDSSICILVQLHNPSNHTIADDTVADDTIANDIAADDTAVNDDEVDDPAIDDDVDACPNRMPNTNTVILNPILLLMMLPMLVLMAMRCLYCRRYHHYLH